MASAPLRMVSVPFSAGGQAMEIVDLPLRELRQHVEPPEALQLAPEVIGQVAEQMLGLAARLLGLGARLLGLRSARCARWPLK